MPLLPLRDVVVFPHMVIPLFVGRPKSIKALETAMEAGKSIVLVAQKSAAKDDPLPEDLYRIGSIANILQMLKLPDGTVKVLVEGSQRARLHEIVDLKTHYAVGVTPVAADTTADHEIEAMRRTMIQQFDQYVKLNKKIPPEILTQPKNALLKQFQKMFGMEGVELEVREAALKAVARRALERKTGARGLRSILEHTLLNTMFDLPSLENVVKVVVDENTIVSDATPLLIYSEQPKVAGSAH